MRSVRPVLFGAFCFAAGVAVGALAFRGRTESETWIPAAESGGAAATTGTEADPPSHPATESAARPESPAGAASPAAAQPATLAAPLGDFDRRLRRLVAAAGRNALGEDLPPDYLEEAVRRARENVDALPESWGRNLAQREVMRRRFGELGDRWEIVVQVRTTSSLDYELADLGAERPRHVLATAPLDVVKPLEVRGDEDAVFVRGGVAPLQQTAVLEEVEIRGQFGTASRPVGEVEARFGGYSLPTVRGRGQTHVRLGGSTQAPWWWTGFGPSNASVEFQHVAAEVTFRGRLHPRDSNVPVPRQEFRALTVEGDGFLMRGPVRMQVVANHGGSNAIGLDGVSSRIDAMSERPVWDDALDLMASRRSSGFASGTGILPLAKAFRLRRVEWRARFAELRNGEFRVQAGGTDLVSLRARDLLSREETRDRESRRVAKDEFRSGVWTGDVLIQAGRESQTSLTCGSFVMGEAVFEGELVDDPR